MLAFHFHFHKNTFSHEKTNLTPETLMMGLGLSLRADTVA